VVLLDGMPLEVDGAIGAGATIIAAAGATATIGAGATTIGAAAIGPGAGDTVVVVELLVSELSASPIEALPSSDAIPKAIAAVLNEYFMVKISPLFCS